VENKKYSLLVIALYCYSGHVKGVIEHLKAVNPLVDITLLADNADEMRSVLTDKSVKVEWYNVPPVNIKWRWLKYAIIKHRQCRFFAKFHKGRRYDIVNIQFPYVFMAYVYPSLRAMSDNLVITPWGSDILRRDKEYLQRLASLYQQADYIATSPTTSLGKRIIEEMHIKPNKLVGNFFGSDLVDFALKNGMSITTDDAKKHFGLSGRYVISCGYNRREPQRHKVMIAAIDQIRSQLPENLSLLFPMSYGADTRPEYIDECKKECEERNLPAVFVTHFLSVEELYLLRMSTDIFVHVQTTDASSGSVKEYILCDKKIVHGSWIKYDDLEAFQPLFYFPVDRLENLGEVIVKAYHSDKIAIPQGVLDFVKSGGWERKATRMNDFYLSIV
jgi:hypothetical protein